MLQQGRYSLLTAPPCTPEPEVRWYGRACQYRADVRGRARPLRRWILL